MAFMLLVFLVSNLKSKNRWYVDEMLKKATKNSEIILSIVKNDPHVNLPIDVKFDQKYHSND